MMNPLNRTKTLGIKVSETAFETLREFAESRGKPLSEWYRDTLMKAAMPPPPRTSDLAVLAEITAAQALLIDLLVILGRDGRILTPKAKEIVDSPHNSKFKEAVQLMQFAYARAGKLNLSAGWRTED